MQIEETIFNAFNQVQIEILSSEKSICRALKDNIYDLFFLQIDFNFFNEIKIAKMIRNNSINANAQRLRKMLCK